MGDQDRADGPDNHLIVVHHQDTAPLLKFLPVEIQLNIRLAEIKKHDDIHKNISERDQVRLGDIPEEQAKEHEGVHD